jgi:hypothetical protein
MGRDDIVFSAPSSHRDGYNPGVYETLCTILRRRTVGSLVEINPLDLDPQSEIFDQRLRM